MFGKIINGALETAPERLIFENTLYLPPTEAVLKAAGYKLIVELPYPKDGNTYTPEYTDNGQVIVESWVLSHALTPAERRKNAYETEREYEYNGELYTVDELEALYYHYNAETGKSDICKALKSAITAAKKSIRDKYPDEAEE